MTYREALDWLYGFSDMERGGAFVRDREDNLARERTLLAALGDPHLGDGITHVAGSKGKGSTAAMIAAILDAAGVRAGLYTQPDLHTFRERVRVGSALVSEREVAEYVAELQAAVAAVGDRLGPFITYELGTALAFLHFRRAGVRHAVIEVGLGGRLDATNVVRPLVTVITSISYEHVEVLGHTLAAIAREKAGIVKPGAPLVCSARSAEALAVIERICAERGAPLVRVGPAGAPGLAVTFRPLRHTARAQWLEVRTPAREYRDLEFALLGAHQLENAAAAAAAGDALARLGLPVDEAAVRTGLRGVRWPARLQVAGERPWLVVDGAHNADSVEKLLAALDRHLPHRRLLLVLGLLSDKDVEGIAAALAAARVDRVIATAARSARAMPPERIAAALSAAAPDLAVYVEPEVGAALAAAVAAAAPDDLVCVAGSLYVAGEALRWFAAHGGAARMAPIAIAGVDH
jgi:dihydrofolate synthase/folylpolyglutamate synthase